MCISDCVLEGRPSRLRLKTGGSLCLGRERVRSFFDRGIPNVGDTGSTGTAGAFREDRGPLARVGERREELELIEESEVIPEVEAELSSGGVACCTVIFTGLGLTFGGVVIPLENVR